MAKHSIAVDIGASSGRLILGSIENGLLKLEEIHRFENKIEDKSGHFCWDVEKLFTEIKEGLKKCYQSGIKPESIGIDTWAVDYVLLDENDERITDAVSYRDPRTNGMMEEVFKLIPKEELYLETGIQFQKFNTIYQLFATKQQQPELLDKAKAFLMIPDYFNFLLTGKKANEYTNATTTQLVNGFTKQWDHGILNKLGIRKEIFQEICMPKTVLGSLTKELEDELGFSMKVILPATHDTGSAVIAVPEEKETIYISSGTWSLMGVENRFPISVSAAMNDNFTNEGGIDYRFRFLKNIMGLWMIQEVKRNYDDQYSFADFVCLAEEAADFSSTVDVNDDRFLKPENMVMEIRNFCEETGQRVPETPGEVAKCVYDSLAKCYHTVVQEIEEIFERPFEQINVIGGGCKNEMLNQLIADETGKKVYAGPVEATAIGNLVSQLITLGEIEDINQARTIIRRSFEMKKYEPKVLMVTC